MKKYLLSLFMMLCVISAINPASALTTIEIDVCVDQCNVPSGTACGDSVLGDDGVIGGGTTGPGQITSQCEQISAGLSGIWQTCNGKCQCLPKGSCSSGGTETPTVKKCKNADNIIWGSPNLGNRVTGTCDSTSNETLTVYACADGTYIEGDDEFPNGGKYSSESSIRCIECPDYTTNKVVDLDPDCATIITTNGIGLRHKDACAVKKNCLIEEDGVGKFVFQDNCKY